MKKKPLETTKRGGRKKPVPRPLKAPEVSPEPHRRAREARAEELAEDYVEVIDDLIRQYGEARVVDVAERLGVTHVTVTRTVARVQKQGLVRAERYRSIFLSDAGRKLAERAGRRHGIVLEFLRALGVRDATARIDAEGIEHHVSEHTLQAFQRFCGLKLTKKQRTHLSVGKGDAKGGRKGVPGTRSEKL